MEDQLCMYIMVFECMNFAIIFFFRNMTHNKLKIQIVICSKYISKIYSVHIYIVLEFILNTFLLY